MSEENVELARAYIEAYHAGGLDATEPLRHPEMEVLDPPTFPDASSHVGEQAVRRVVEGYVDLGWDGVFHDPEFHDAGDQVLVVWQFRGESAHGGGFPLEATMCHLYDFEDGKVRRIRQFMSREEGMEAAGLAKGAN